MEPFTVVIDNINITFVPIKPNTDYTKEIKALNRDYSIWKGNAGSIYGAFARYFVPNSLTSSFYEYYVTQFGQGKSIGFLLYDGQDFVGIFGLKYLERHDNLNLEPGRNYYRLDISLLHRYQHKGIATQMVDVVRHYISHINIDYIVLDVLSQNKKSRHMISKTNAQLITKGSQFLVPKYHIYLINMNTIS